MVTSVRSRIAKAIWDNGVRTAVDRHQGCRSHTTSGAYSSLANRTGLPSTSCAARRSFPPTSCHRKGATSRQRLGAPSAPVRDERSEERRVGKGCVRTCRSRWSSSHSKNNRTSYNSHESPNLDNTVSSHV